MANRLSNDYYTFAVAEGTYGTKQTTLTSAVAMSDTVCEIHKDVQTTPTKIKTTTLEPDHEESIITSTAATVTLKGNLCTGYQWLLQAYFMKAASAYVMTSPQPAISTGFEYTIYKYYPSVVPYYDCGVGCVMSDLKLSGEANGIIGFEATFRAKSMERGTASALTGMPANTPSTPFIFGNVTAILYDTQTTLINFNLNLSKNFVDDRITYQNSLTKVAEIMTGYSGTLEYSVVYDDVADAVDAYIGDTSIEVTDSIVLISGTVEWTILTYGMIADFSPPDVDKSLFEGKYTMQLATSPAAAVPITITVT